MNVARSLSTTFSTCIALMFCTETPGPRCHLKRRHERFRSPLEIQWRRYAGTWKWRSEECNISIASKVENVADELKTKFCARYLGCPIGLIQDALAKTCQLPVVQGDTEGSFIPFNKHFPKCWEPFCLNSLR